MVRNIRKKGSLNLSVEAIVVLVMAITMLGLGLGFIRDKFGSAGNLIDDVQEKVKEDAQRDLSNNNKKLSFPKTEFTLENGESEVGLVGLKNLYDKKYNFKIEIRYQSNGEMNEYDPENPSPAELTYSGTYNNIGSKEIQLIPFKIKANINAGDPSDYIYEFRVLAIPSDGSSSEEIYFSKNFFLNII